MSEHAPDAIDRSDARPPPDGESPRTGVRRRGGVMRFTGLLLAAALLFSGDLVRIHGHADGAPASSDCAACVAGLGAAVEDAAPPALDPPVPATFEARSPAPRLAPALPFVRQGGLRDPPSDLA